MNGWLIAYSVTGGNYFVGQRLPPKKYLNRKPTAQDLGKGIFQRHQLKGMAYYGSVKRIVRLRRTLNKHL
jgi:hypothetical protein